MTIDEALQHPQPLIAVWDESPSKDAWLGVFALPEDGAPTLLAHEKLQATQRASRTSDLRAKGILIGSAAGSGPAIWHIDDSFRVWSDALRFEASTSTVRIGERTLAREEVAGVTTFVDDSRCHRGVRLDLRDGTEVVVAEEHDDTATLEPTYGRDMLMVDAFWASLLGNRLAKWLGVRHFDEI